MSVAAPPPSNVAPAVRLFLCGDVMIGRGVDQILPSPCPPKLYEEYVSSAEDYVRLAEAASGPIPRPVEYSYVWGVALAELEAHAPDARIVNLETSVTRSEAAEPKAINYRVSPQNAECLRVAGFDCCALANNHVLDWGPSGLLETLDMLERLGIAVTGAGRALGEAQRPAIIEIPSKGRRVVVLSFALPDSGTPLEWAATPSSPGVNLLRDLSPACVDFACNLARNAAQSGDILVISIHWGSNWGYGVSTAQRQFAHRLIEDAGASVIHGHSSHHAKGFEVHRNRLVLYGCGDFLNDYEGISGYESYRGDLSLMYFADIDTNGDLVQLRLVPLHMRRLRLERATTADAEWLAQTLDRESAAFGVRVRRQPDGALSASWSGGE